MVVRKKKRCKISSVKRSNQKRTKLIKQGKMPVKRNKRASNITRNPKKQKQTQKPVDEPQEQESDDDMTSMVDVEDLDFLKQAVAERSYSMLKRIRYTGVENKSEENGDKPAKARRKKEVTSDDELEENFERDLGSARADLKPMKELLPVKTADGQVQRRTVAIAEKYEEPEVKTEELQDSEPEEDSRMDLSEPVSTAQLLFTRQKQLERYRISIGALSSGVLEDPKGKLGNLKKLLALVSEPQPAEIALTVPRLAAVSLSEVFRDLLPEYPIRDSPEQDGVKLKKETRELHTEEQSLLASYRKYLAVLEKLLQPINLRRTSKKFPETRTRLALVALKCLGVMVESRPTFNYSFNIARLLVPMLDNRRSPEAREIASKYLASVLRSDKRGDISLEIARRVNALIKARSNVRPECVKLLINLRIKDVDLDAARQAENKAKRLQAKKHKMIASSKRERKRAKRMEGLEKELLETKAEESKQTQLRNFTETTKLAFTVFFRVLKSEPRPALLAATLECLAKFAHCINIDIYGDLMRVLEQLLELDELNLRLKLLCIKTLLAILSGHGQFLTIDPARFHAQLYRCLIPICSGATEDELSSALQPLTSVVCSRRHSVSQHRLLAFSKRLATVSLNQPHHGALACLQLVRSTLQLNRGVDVLLETESRAGKYLPELDEPEHCGAASTSLFELSLMQRHYHPTTVNLAKHVAQGAPLSDDSLTPVLRNTTAENLYSNFSPTEDMKFNPIIPSPNLKPKQRLHFAAQTLHDPELRNWAEQLLEDESPCIDYYAELHHK